MRGLITLCALLASLACTSKLEPSVEHETTAAAAAAVPEQTTTTAPEPAPAPLVTHQDAPGELALSRGHHKWASRA